MIRSINNKNNNKKRHEKKKENSPLFHIKYQQIY